MIGPRANTPKSSAVDLIVFLQHLYVEAFNFNVIMLKMGPLGGIRFVEFMRMVSS